MSVVTAFPRSHGPDLDSLSRAAGIAAIVGAKAADVAITLPVLRTHPSGEANPVIRFVYLETGTIGVVALSLTVVLAAVALIEIQAALFRSITGSDLGAVSLRLGLYAATAGVWLVIVARNVAIVAEAL